MYPDSFWALLFGKEIPVPNDADCVLEFLIGQSGLSERTLAIIDMHFRRGLNDNAIGAEFGISGSRAYQIARESARKIRDKTRLSRGGFTLKYGWAVNKQLIAGTLDICCNCEKTISEKEYAYVVPSRNFATGKPGQKLCCSEAYAKKVLERDKAKYREDIDKIEAKLVVEKAAYENLQGFTPSPLPLKDAWKQMRGSGQDIISRAKAVAYDLLPVQGSPY